MSARRATLGDMATYSEIRDTAEEAQRQAAAIARTNPNNEQMRVLAIATAETARVVAELARKVRNLDD